MKRITQHLLSVISLFILAACGGNATLPDPIITSVTPDVLTAGDRFIIKGGNYYGATDATTLKVEMCGVTINAELNDPEQRSILLPPGGKITAAVSSELTGTLPLSGFTTGVSSVSVTRPDGRSVTLNNAVTCEAELTVPEEPEEPAPEEPEPEEPETPAAPTITSFTAPTSSEPGQPITFTWTITNEDDSDLTCSFNPGDETGVVTITGCSGPVEHTYAAAGTFTAELTVTDQDEQTDTATHEVTVTEPAPSIPTAPGITEFTGPHNALLGDTATFTWTISNEDSSDLTCTIDPGDETGIITVDCETPFEYTYATTGTFTATLTITDGHAQSTSAGHEVIISLRPTTVITRFTAPHAALLDEYHTYG